VIERQKGDNFGTKEVDEMVVCLNGWVSNTTGAHCPRAKSSMYMKRRLHDDLTAQRKSYTYWRNRASAIRRQGRAHPVLEEKFFRLMV
jgi:hypothetical protein